MMRDVLREALEKYGAKTVGSLVFKDRETLLDFARKNNVEIRYELDEIPLPEINPRKPSTIQPELRGILWIFEKKPQILMVQCLEEEKNLNVWTEKDERRLEWINYIARLRDYHRFQPETLAIIDKMEMIYNGSEYC